MSELLKTLETGDLNFSVWKKVAKLNKWEQIWVTWKFRLKDKDIFHTIFQEVSPRFI